MSKQQTLIIEAHDLTTSQSQALVVIGTPKATATARKDAVKTLHAALLTADPRASAKAMMDTTARLVAAMKPSDPTLSSGAAYVEMRTHLMRTGDFRPPLNKRSGNASTGGGPASNLKQIIAPTPSTERKKKGFFRSLLRRD